MISIEKVRYCVPWYNKVWYGMAWHMTLHGLVRYVVVYYSTISELNRLTGQRKP